MDKELIEQRVRRAVRELGLAKTAALLGLAPATVLRIGGAAKVHQNSWVVAEVRLPRLDAPSVAKTSTVAPAPEARRVAGVR
jgi:hypothetical protein